MTAAGILERAATQQHCPLHALLEEWPGSNCLSFHVPGKAGVCGTQFSRMPACLVGWTMREQQHD